MMGWLQLGQVGASSEKTSFKDMYPGSFPQDDPPLKPVNSYLSHWVEKGASFSRIERLPICPQLHSILNVVF